MSEMLQPGTPSMQDVINAGIAGTPLPEMPANPNISPGEAMGELLSKLVNDNGELLPVAASDPVAEQAAIEAAKVEAPAAEALTPEADATAGEFKQGRFRIKDEGDQALILFARANGMTIQQAALQMAGQQTAAALEQKQPVPQLHEVLAQKEARFDELRTKLGEEVKGSEGVGLTVTEEFLELQDLARELPLLQIEAKREDRQTAKSDATSFQQYRELAVQQYPDAAKEGTPLYDAIAAESAKVIADPNHPLWGAPDRAHLITVRAATKLGIAPVMAQPVQGDPKTPATPSATPATPRAFAPAAGTSASDAPRATVQTGTPSPTSLFREGLAAAGAGVEGVRAGLQKILNPTGAAVGAKHLW